MFSIRANTADWLLLTGSSWEPNEKPLAHVGEAARHLDRGEQDAGEEAEREADRAPG